MDTQEKLLSQPEAATLIGITRQAINYAVNAGLLPARQVGSYQFVTESDALRYQKNISSRGWKKGIKRRKKR